LRLDKDVALSTILKARPRGQLTLQDAAAETEEGQHDVEEAER
jgi:hypothetical protein